MWLLYKLLEETDTIYKYAYSRETYDLDGIIVYDKKTGMTIVEKPCLKDKDIMYSINHAKEVSISLFKRDFQNREWLHLDNIRETVDP